MGNFMPQSSLQLRSKVKATGQLELSLVDEPAPVPGPDEVVVRIDAAPINPSDLFLLLGPADLSTLKVTGTLDRPVVTADVASAALRALAARVDQSMPVGIEGAGLVVAAGASPAAQALLDRKVATMGGAMFSQFRCVPVNQCLLLPDDATAVDGASAFVNPLTALGFIETMRAEGHSALANTAAASSLGQMLNRICIADGVKLVNIVRKPEQVTLLRDQGAAHVIDSSTESFQQDLTEALFATGATIGFDAIGGGKLCGQILNGMEAAINRSTREYSRYGSSIHKQIYIYGGLDSSPTQLVRHFGMAWSLGGWLLMPFMQKAGPAVMKRLQDRVRQALKTTFASHYSRHISLAEALQPDVITEYARPATGQKFLIVPNGS